MSAENQNIIVRADRDWIPFDKVIDPWSCEGMCQRIRNLGKSNIEKPYISVLLCPENRLRKRKVFLPRRVVQEKIEGGESSLNVILTKGNRSERLRVISDCIRTQTKPNEHDLVIANLSQSQFFKSI